MITSALVVKMQNTIWLLKILHSQVVRMTGLKIIKGQFELGEQQRTIKKRPDLIHYCALTVTLKI